MRCRLFTILSALSLLLAIASGVFWVRSYWVGDFLQQIICGCVLEESSQRGSLTLTCYGWVPGTASASHRSKPADSLRMVSWYGVAWSTGAGGDFRCRIGLPHWGLLLTSLIVPLLWLNLRARRQQRLKAGYCAHCGYDLRATTERCPECGTPRPPDPHGTLATPN